MIGRWVRRALLAGLALVVLVAGYFAVTFAQVWWASSRDRARPADAIVVLGAAQYDGRPSPVLQARLDHAIDLYERELAPVIVVTGGRRPGDRFSEAAAGSRYLLSQGVPEPAIRREVTGTSSWESLAAAARFLRREGIEEVILVSSPYHALRAEQVAGEVGLRGVSSPATGPHSGGAAFDDLYKEAFVVGVGRIVGFRRVVDLDTKVERVRDEATGEVRQRSGGR